MLRRGLVRTVAGALLGTGILAGTAYWIEAREPVRPVGMMRNEEKATMHSGRVEKFLTNDHGDVDGLRFTDGFETHFPPHIGRRVSELVEPGADATIWGQKEVRPRGEVVFEASRIESGTESIQVNRPRPPAGPRGKRKDDRPMTAKGKVEEFTSNHHGDVDGILLADNTEVKFPPHRAEDLQKIVNVGDQVQIDGRRHETPHGDIHLHADLITVPSSGKSWNREEPDHRPPARRQVSDRRDDPSSQPSNEEVLRELREIRRLLEELKR